MIQTIGLAPLPHHQRHSFLPSRKTLLKRAFTP
jgi:hypothetical protein